MLVRGAHQTGWSTARLGAEEIAHRVQGSIRWGALDDPQQPLVKVEIHLTESIDQAIAAGMTVTEVATALGLTKGRISQIRR